VFKLTNLYKNRKKGFTLVEIIVVLVIIAILMAALAPVMIGWINEARMGTELAEARTGLTAAQAVAADLVAKASTPFTETQTIANTNAKFIELLNEVPNTRFTNITFNPSAMVLTIRYQGTRGYHEYLHTGVGGTTGTWTSTRGTYTP
jgi:type IV pilus assembly protein PilA